MNEFKQLGDGERVFVRHAKEKLRADIHRMTDVVRPPFPTSSHSACAAPVAARPTGRWLLGVETANHSWIALFSNAASGSEIFKAVAKSRNLEAVCVGYDPGRRGWVFQFNRAGKRVVDFSLPPGQAGQIERARFESSEHDARLLAGYGSGDQALDRLCQTIGLDRTACQLQYSEREFRALNAQGNPLGRAVRGHFLLTGHLINEGENPASDALAKAIERCDPEAIRKAVADGARLDALPDTTVSPLLSALFKCCEPRGKDCVASLVELGASVNGVPGDNPPIVDSVAHFVNDDLALEMLRTIAPLGADVNAASPWTGDTALHEVVAYRREQLVRFLLDHGADPGIKNNAGLSPLDWLTQRLARADDKDRREYGKIRALLAGEPMEDTAPPAKCPLNAEHAAVVRRQIAQCLGIDVARIVPSAAFLADLGGTVEHLRPLRTGIEQALGISVEPIADAVNTRTEIDAQGNVTYDSLRQIQSYLPGWSAPLVPTPFPSLFTVSMIEAMVAKAFTEKKENATQDSVRLAPEHSATVRKRIARHAKVSVETLTPETNLFRDLKLSGTTVGLCLAMLKTELDCDLIDGLGKLESEFQVDRDGQLTNSSRKRLQRLLPGVPLSDAAGLTLDDLYTVGMVEALAAQALAERPKDLPFEGILGLEQQEWVQQLPQELGERKLRLLLAGGCRYALRQRLARGQVEREVTDALELLERFADSGQSKKELRDFRKAFWGQWRETDNRTYRALHDALNPALEPEAVTALARAIQQADRISDKEAVRDLRQLCRDLAPPAGFPGAFPAAWRTSQAVALAESMYQRRDFQDMPRLADMLASAGCNDPAVLEHCRKPDAVHLRGCWVIDALLDGSWAKTLTAPPAPAKRKTLLDTLAKPAQYAIRQIMEREGGRLTLTESLARRWDFEGFAKSQGMNDERIANRVPATSRMYPTWTAEQVKFAMSIQSLVGNWSTEIAIARRMADENPAELGQGACIADRLAWLYMRLMDAACPGMGHDVGPWAIVETLAVRDLPLARCQAERAAHPIQEEDQARSLPCQALLAAFQGDCDALRSLVAAMFRRKPYPFQKWMFTGLKGIVERDPTLVAEALSQRLEYESHQRLADRRIVVTEAHGWYWLCRGISPELVAAIDVNRALPWDAEFHAWTEAHENPLEGIDLNGISPLLHKAVVSLELPDWWAAAADVGLPNDPCAVVINDVGPNPGTVVQYVRHLVGVTETDAKDMLKSCPAVVCTDLPRLRAWHVVQDLRHNGAAAELRVLDSAPKRILLEPEKSACGGEDAPEAAKRATPEPKPPTAEETPLQVSTETHAAGPSGGSAARHFEFVEGKSSKFWEISVDGCTVTVRFGRIGSAGQSKVKTFADAAAAQRDADKLIKEKTGKGYAETG